MFWEDLREFPNFVLIQPNDRHDEFEYTRDLLNRIDISSQFIFMVDTNWIPQLGFPYSFLQKYQLHAQKNNLTFKVLFLNLGEGVYYENFKSHIAQLKLKYNVPNENIIIFSLAIPYKTYPVKHAITYRATCREDILPSSRADIIPTHHFVSLSRVPRKQRILANVEILQRGLNQYGNMSICSMVQSIDNDRIKTFTNIIPEELRDKFPTYLDGPTDESSKLDWFYTVDPRITHAAIHVVMETSYEYPDPWGTQIAMISEKSMKPLAWGQLPLFVCYGGQVNKLRELGFDLFDDFVDHSYDNELDPDKRIISVVNELERLCKSKTVADLQQYKQANIHRFTENRQKTLDFFQNEKWQYSFCNLKAALEN
jgi:hypothetical protein